MGEISIGESISHVVGKKPTLFAASVVRLDGSRLKAWWKAWTRIRVGVPTSAVGSVRSRLDEKGRIRVESTVATSFIHDDGSRRLRSPSSKPQDVPVFSLSSRSFRTERVFPIRNDI